MDYPYDTGKTGIISHFPAEETRSPEKERDRIPVLADGDHILWVIGYRISDYYKITDETERVLEAEMILPDGGDRSEDGGGRAGIWNCKGEDHG